MVSKYDFEKILPDNGFSYHIDPDWNGLRLIIDTINVSEIHENIKYVFINNYVNEEPDLTIYIELKNYKLGTLNSSIDLSMYTPDDTFIARLFTNKEDLNDLIEELHRLNIIGQNIKG